MKKNYFISMIFGLIFLTLHMGQSQNILLAGYFSVPMEIIHLDTPRPPIDSSATTTSPDNVELQDFRPDTLDKIVIAGSFQSSLNCPNDWDPSCDSTELSFNSTTGLYTGTFHVPFGSHRYKVTVGGSWEINYGENGLFDGPDIFLCVTSSSEEITFTYDPSTNLVTTSQVTSGFSPDCLPLVVLAGTFQDELGCEGEWIPDCTNTALIYNPGTGLFEGAFNIPTGCYEYRVVLENIWQNNFGQGGKHNGLNYTLYIPANPGLTHFTYDPVSHIVSSTPYNDPISEVTKVSLVGTFQYELGCAHDYQYECDYPALHFNPNSGAWEGSFSLPPGCYSYRVKETFGCNTVTFYGEDGVEEGNEIQIYVPSGEITFSYDPQTHIINTTPDSDVPQEITSISLQGTLQDELGCASDYEYECNKPALLLNPETGAWEGTFTLPAGCYTYLVKETFACNMINFYGENGIELGDAYQLLVPIDSEITFSYDLQSHIITSSPYSGAPQEVTKVSLYGSLQDELGCANDYEIECDTPALEFNSDSGVWEGNFTLPAGCYSYRVKESFGCYVNIYGENGIEWGVEIQLYVPTESEITFIYDPLTHNVISTPYSGAPQEAAKVSLIGTLQDELGCAYDYEFECDKPALVFNLNSNAWEGSFTLPAGCYLFMVKETSLCDIVSFYGENGNIWGKEIQLYVPTEAEITFSYDPQTHIMSSTPYSGAPQEATKVSFLGSLQSELGCFYDYNYECDQPALVFNPDTGAWEGSFTLPAGCYSYMVLETSICNIVSFYGEEGIEWGKEIQLYVPSEAEITFSYDPQTHIISSSPYSGASQEATKVSLMGNLQAELGCDFDYDDSCDNPALQLNPNTGAWEGSFTLPAGCYSYRVKETSVCTVRYIGEDGFEWGNEILLYIPTEGEITFSYNPQTRIISSTPYTATPQKVTTVALIGTLQDELGCAYDYEDECGNSALEFNLDSGAWEGSFVLPAGCYSYLVKETFSCNIITYYGENGMEWGDVIQLYVPSTGEITFSYDPQTHIINSTPYTDMPTLIQCPANISVNNDPGICGAILYYPDFSTTANCGGEIVSVTQIEGLPGGSLFPVGLTTNTFLIIKTTGEEIICSFDIEVVDTESPVISGLNQSHETLWPPNHKMVPVFIDYLVTDNCDISSTVLSISSNEPVNGPGDGNTTPDWEILDEHNFLLRAERSGKGNGREYYITIIVTDDSGNLTEQLVTVKVPHDNGKNSPVVMQSDNGYNKFTLYPNGADDLINLKGPKSTSNSPYVIYDMLGVVKNQGIIKNDQIEVVTLIQGIYILKFETDDGYVFKKFIKN